MAFPMFHLLISHETEGNDLFGPPNASQGQVIHVFLHFFRYLDLQRPSVPSISDRLAPAASAASRLGASRLRLRHAALRLGSGAEATT